jgi:hypothetical protein
VPLTHLENHYKSHWNHYAVTISAAENAVKLYYNGELLTQENCSVPADWSDIQRFIIGRSISQDSDWYGGGVFKGRLDEFKIYNKVLSQQEIIHLSGKATFYQKVYSPANLNDDDSVNIDDYAHLAEIWLKVVLWPG